MTDHESLHSIARCYGWRLGANKSLNNKRLEYGENGHRYELGNRMPSFTKFEVEGLKPHDRNNSVHDFAKVLIPGMMVELTYMPYEYNGRLPRLIAVKEVHSIQK